MSTTLTRDIPIAWSHIREARKLVQEALADHDAELREAAGMTMSELIENAMKYGEPVPKLPGARFTLEVDDDGVSIQVQNGSGSEACLAKLVATVEAIAGAQGKDAREALYIERLQQLMEDPSAGGQLGLYRVGYEGGFDLSCACEDQIITVTARRSFR